MHMAFSMKVTPEIEELTNICLDNSKMDGYADPYRAAPRK